MYSEFWTIKFQTSVLSNYILFFWSHSAVYWVQIDLCFVFCCFQKLSRLRRRLQRLLSLRYLASAKDVTMTDEEDDLTDDQIVSKIKEIIEDGNNLSVKISVRMILKTNSSLFSDGD